MLASPESVVFRRLVTAPAVAAAVEFRVFPIAVPKGASFPFIVYKRQNIIREPHLAGPDYRPMVSLQVAMWAMTHDAARVLADDVRIALDGHITDVLGCRIEDMRLVSETDDYLDPATVGAQLPPAYEVRQLYQIRWVESAE